MDELATKRLKNIVVPIAIGAILTLALWLLFGELRHYRFRDIAKGLSLYPLSSIALAGLLTFLSYLILTLFDTMGCATRAPPSPGRARPSRPF